MKRFSTFLFLLFCGAFLQAQDYQPMVLEGAHWFGYSYDCDHGNFEQTIQNSWGYAIKGDTIVNGQVYKKVYYQQYFRELQEDCLEAPTAPYAMITENLYGFIREDIEEQKVYAILFEEMENCSPNEEKLWWDFSLIIGDTLSTNRCYPEYLTVYDSYISDFMGQKDEFGNLMNGMKTLRL